MIIKYNKPVVTSKCDKCKKIHETEITKPFEKEEMSGLGHYQNLKVKCDCGTSEIFNTNIDKFQFSYDEIEEMKVNNEEINQRHYLTQIIKDFRGDYYVSTD